MNKPPDAGQRSLKNPVLFCVYFDRVDAELDNVLSFDTTCMPVDARQGYALGVHLRRSFASKAYNNGCDVMWACIHLSLHGILTRGLTPNGK